MTDAAQYIGWLLHADDRRRLLVQIPPAYPDLVADHVTLIYRPPAGFSLPTAAEGLVVGIADDGAGLQALVLEIEGTTRRPDGSTFHVTWSLDRAAGRRPVESNAMIRAKSWAPVTPPILLRLAPRAFR